MLLSPRCRAALSMLFFCLPLLAGTAPSSLSLTVSSASSAIGRPIILTATVAPPEATGKVVFLDGISILGTSTLNGGEAILTNALMSTGAHLLHALYLGDGIYANSTSAPVPQTTNSLPSTGLVPSASYTIPVSNSFYMQVATADFNRDGHTDLAVTSDVGISVLLGLGDGTFGPATTFGSNPSVGVASADFNGDGVVDLAVVSNTANNVAILLGNGDGTFQTPSYILTAQAPNSVAVADLNGDGLGDLVVSYGVNGTTTGGLSEILGNGDGTFQPVLNIATSYPLSFIAAADLNNDGLADLVATDLNGSYVHVFLGNGGGSFQDPVSYNGVDYATGVAVADLNGDGLPDLVVSFDGGQGAPSPPTQPQSYDVAVFLGTGNGAFGAPASYACAGEPWGVTIADFNGDSKLDVAVADPFGGTASVLLGNGNGTLGPATVYRLPQLFAATPAAGDFNGDGVIDLVVSNLAGTQNLSILLGQPTPPAQVFVDVVPSDYYFTAVNDLFTLGITNGCGALSFCPDQPLPRWQAAIFLVRAVMSGDNFTASPIAHFADVPVDTPGFTWIQKLYELGITSGCGNDSSGVPLFCPDDILTRDEASILIIRARYGATTPFDWSNTPYFTDVPSGSFAFPWIQRLGEDNISAGCAADLYCPSDDTTRGEMAVLIVRAEFNLLLPGAQPLISASSPTTVTQGSSVIVAIAGKNTHFVQGATQLVFSTSTGLTVNSIQVTSPTSMSFTLAASSAALAEPTSIYVQTGSEEAVLPNGIIVLQSAE